MPSFGSAVAFLFTTCPMMASLRSPRRGVLTGLPVGVRSGEQLGTRRVMRLGVCSDLMRHRATRRGFTLIEILVVIVVIAILATLVAPNIFKHVGSAKEATAKSQIEMLGTALDAYRLDNATYPTSDQGFESLQTAPNSEPMPTNWRGPYLRKDVPLDPWGHPYVYKYPGEANPNGYDLMSYGADGQPGGDDENADITSWK